MSGVLEAYKIMEPFSKTLLASGDLKAGCIGKYGKNWLLSSQREAYSSKMANLASMWGTLACREEMSQEQLYV